jgi:hypothetical protein
MTRSQVLPPALSRAMFGAKRLAGPGTAARRGSIAAAGRIRCAECDNGRVAIAYQEVGADLPFGEVPTSMGQIRPIRLVLVGGPQLTNLLQGGRKRELSTAELGDLGHEVSLREHVGARSSCGLGRHLAETGIIDDAIVRIRSWQPGQGLVRVEELDTLDNELTERCVGN